MEMVAPRKEAVRAEEVAPEEKEAKRVELVALDEEAIQAEKVSSQEVALKEAAPLCVQRRLRQRVSWGVEPPPPSRPPPLQRVGKDERTSRLVGESPLASLLSSERSWRTIYCPWDK